ncbi:nascent polypeptide-associated complex subunit beta, partial [Phenoliferia sp. Uapishka_3]
MASTGIDMERLAKLQAATRIGGKGTPRRKVVVKPRAGAQGDDKKLQGALKKLGVTPMAGVEEVNMFQDDGNVVHFTAPKGEPSYLEGEKHDEMIVGRARPWGWRPHVEDVIPVSQKSLPFFLVVHAAIGANTYAIYGKGETKEITELVPGILNQLGPEAIANLRKMAEQFTSQQQGGAAEEGEAEADDDDDEPPELVEATAEPTKDGGLEDIVRYSLFKDSYIY